MHQKEENLTENHTTPTVSEIYTKQSTKEENSSFFHEYCFVERQKRRCINLKSETSQDYSQKPQQN